MIFRGVISCSGKEKRNLTLAVVSLDAEELARALLASLHEFNNFYLNFIFIKKFLKYV